MVDFSILNHLIDSLGSSNRPSKMIKSIIFFWPSTEDEFDYLEGSPIVDHHIWSARPSRYSGWPSIFFRALFFEKRSQYYVLPCINFTTFLPDFIFWSFFALLMLLISLEMIEKYECLLTVCIQLISNANDIKILQTPSFSPLFTEKPIVNTKSSIFIWKIFSVYKILNYN